VSTCDRGMGVETVCDCMVERADCMLVCGTVRV